MTADDDHVNAGEHENKKLKKRDVDERIEG
jgi:hypothetical protein